MLCPSLNLGGYCRQTHAVWGGEGQDHQQPAGWSWANYYTTAMVIRYLRSTNISLYHTMVLSAVTHSLVIGRKVRNEDPTADTSMVTRPPHHTYTMLVAGLLQTQIQKLLWILQIFPYNSQQTLTPLWATAHHSVLVNVSMLECIGLAVLLCIWVWKHVEMIYLCDCV